MGKGWVLVTLLLLTSCSAAIDFQSIVDDNPGTTVNINKLTGENAELLLSSLTEFCPDAGGKELYRVQVIGDNSTITKILDKRGKLLCEVDTSDPEFAQKSVAVNVNGEPIYLSEIQTAINNLPQEQRAESAQTVVNNLVNERLLLQEAESLGITASEEEVNQAIDESGLTLSQLTQNDLSSVREQVRDSIILQKMVRRVTESTVEISDAEARQYFQQNNEEIYLPQSWTLRQIQINKGDRTNEQTRDKAETILGLVNTSDFCSLVTQFSDDETSIDTCGRYTFAEGGMVPSVEEQVKSMNEGQISLAESPNAFHVIELISRNERREATFEEAKEQIKNTLRIQLQRQALNQYLQELRNESEIVSYLG